MTTIDVMFVGLCLVCLADHATCPSDSPAGITNAYLVNAGPSAEEYQPCDLTEPLHRIHVPRLIYPAAAEGLRSDRLAIVDDFITSDGRRMRVVDLTGHQLQVALNPAGVKMKGGRWCEHEYPKWFMPDASDSDWIASVPEIDADAVKMLSESDLWCKKRISSIVRFSGGMVSAQSLGHHLEPDKKGDYALWQIVDVTSGTPVSDVDDFPKALAERIRWRRRAEVIDFLRFTDEDGDVILMLKPINDRIELAIANLPQTSDEKRSNPALEHFLWFYRLYPDSSSLCNAPSVMLRKKKKSPQGRSQRPFNPALDETEFCPPATSSGG